MPFGSFKTAILSVGGGGFDNPEGGGGGGLVFTLSSPLTIDNPNAYNTGAEDRFGLRVAVSDNYVIVGAPQEDDAGGLSSGKAYIFDTADGSLVYTLDNPNAYSTSANDFFSNPVAISNTHAIVGAYGEDDAGGVNSGKAYIYDLSDGSLLHTLNNPNAYSTSANDEFGLYVAISGNYAIVGAASEDDAGGGASGKAYIFNVTTGSLLYTLDNPNAYGTTVSDTFGSSVAISDNYAIAGAQNEDDAGGSSSGKAYIYDLTDGSLLYTLDNPNAYSTSANDFFGRAVAISNTHAIVGAYGEDDASGLSSGKAYIYDLSDGSLLYTLDNPNAYSTSASDFFGITVAISNNYAIVGAYGEDDAGGTSSGKAYIYDLADGSLLETLDNPNAYSTSASDLFSLSVAITDDYVVVGAYGEDPSGQSNSGVVYLYNISLT